VNLSTTPKYTFHELFAQPQLDANAQKLCHLLYSRTHGKLYPAVTNTQIKTKGRILSLARDYLKQARRNREVAAFA
jgi:hypothetical protein